MKVFMGLMVTLAIPALGAEIECKVLSKVRLQGKYYACFGYDCSPNQVKAEIQRERSLRIDEKKSEDEVRFNYENSSQEWSILSSKPFEDDETVRQIIQYATTDKKSDVKYYINSGLARIRQDLDSKQNYYNGIPEIHIADYGFSVSRGSRSVIKAFPARFEFTDPMTKNTFELLHSISVNCEE